MRDYKFRAWDKVNKRWRSEKITLISHHDKAFLSDDPDIEIMQFTGLRDRDGREIWEGDVVFDHVGFGVVKYDERYAAFKVSYFRPEGEVGWAKWFYDYNLKGERESIEVTGNIYEHPDLLDSPKVTKSVAKEG